LEKNGLIQNFRYFSKITVPVRTGTIVIVPVRSLSLRTLPPTLFLKWFINKLLVFNGNMFKLIYLINLVILMYTNWKSESSNLVLRFSDETGGGVYFTSRLWNKIRG